MSWSFHCKGTPDKVEEAAKVHMPQAKNCVAHIPQELKTVEAAEAAINAAIAHARENDANHVEIEAYGSAFTKSEWNKFGGLGATIKINVTKVDEETK